MTCPNILFVSYSCPVYHFDLSFLVFKHGSLNGYHKTHALRERARKLSQGILIIRSVFIKEHMYVFTWSITNVSARHNAIRLSKECRVFVKTQTKHTNLFLFRFEMPYNIWCDGCKNHIGMGKFWNNPGVFLFQMFCFSWLWHCACTGVRYNAEKKKVGNYYSTPIYR